MFREIGHALYRRAVDEDQVTIELPSWTWAIFLANLFVLFPIIVILNYSLKLVYPVLAIVEDENPPAYEPVSLDDDAAVPEIANTNDPKLTDPTPHSSHTITSSVRRIHRLLRANGGFRAYVRGLACFVAQLFLTVIPMGFFKAILGEFGTLVGGLVASLALVQFGTAWVHIIISKPSQLHFWKRLPDYRRTFRATWRAVIIYNLANQLATLVPYILASVLNLKVPAFKPGQPTEIPENNGAGWKLSVIIIATLAIVIFVTIPAYVVLIRVQASLLPEEDETIIPFDRSFQGRVEPAVVGGKGWVSVRDAWATFSTAAWRRLLILYVKVSAVLFIFTMLITALVIVPEIALIMSHSKKVVGPR